MFHNKEEKRDGASRDTDDHAASFNRILGVPALPSQASVDTSPANSRRPELYPSCVCGGSPGQFVFGSIKGHRETQRSNEDAVRAIQRPDGVIVAAVCDGVSNCPRPADAANIAAQEWISLCQRIIDSSACPEEMFGRFRDQLTRLSFTESCIEAFNAHGRDMARRGAAEVPSQHYQTNFTGCVLFPKTESSDGRLMIFRIGDGDALLVNGSGVSDPLPPKTDTNSDTTGVVSLVNSLQRVDCQFQFVELELQRVPSGTALILTTDGLDTLLNSGCCDAGRVGLRSSLCDTTFPPLRESDQNGFKEARSNFLRHIARLVDSEPARLLARSDGLGAIELFLEKNYRLGDDVSVVVLRL